MEGKPRRRLANGRKPAVAELAGRHQQQQFLDLASIVVVVVVVVVVGGDQGVATDKFIDKFCQKVF